MSLAHPEPPYAAVPSAWASLTPEQQRRLGCMLIEFELATYASGALFNPISSIGTWASREAADNRACQLLGSFSKVIWPVLPSLFGPDGEHPAWVEEASL